MRRDDPFPTVRIARPTDRLADVVAFDRDAVGFTVLGAFADHAGVDGAMLGFPGAACHLAFTHTRGHVAGRAPDRVGRTYEDPDGYRVVRAHAAWPTHVRDAC